MGSMPELVQTPQLWILLLQTFELLVGVVERACSNRTLMMRPASNVSGHFS